MIGVPKELFSGEWRRRQTGTDPTVRDENSKKLFNSKQPILYWDAIMGRRYIIKKPELSPELAYIHAVILGDGTLTGNGKRLQISDRCHKMHTDVLKPIIKKTFNIEPRIVQKGNGWITEIKSIELFNFLNRELKIPVGKKSYIVEIPEWVLKGTPEIKKSHVIGWMDAEGAVKYKIFKSSVMPRLDFGCKSLAATNGLLRLIEDLERHFQTELPIWKWKSQDGTYHFEFAGPKAVRNYMKNIGLRQHCKKNKVSGLIEKYFNASCCRQS